jgi:hypothetical protein
MFNFSSSSSANSSDAPARAANLSNASIGGPTRDPRTRPMSGSRSVTMSHGSQNPTTMESERTERAGANATDDELNLMYPDFDPGEFVSSDDPTPDLRLEIISRPRDSERWGRE